MIKNIFFGICILSFTACGLSQEELDKQQRIDDSLMDIERIDILAKANQQLLDDSLNTDSLKVDSIK